MRRHLCIAVLIIVPITTGCSPPPQTAFWNSLQALCTQAFTGRMTNGPADDTIFSDSVIIMDVRECREGQIRIPIHVGTNRSRTWIISRTEDGLRLKHHHRHEDGTAEDITDYGGDTRDEGSATRQEFHADQSTASQVPAAATNLWSVEFIPDEGLVYALSRDDAGLRIRLEFDLSDAVVAPPLPWGW